MTHPTEPAILPHASRPYSRAELAVDAWVHIAALALAVGAVPVLITLTAVWRGDAMGITGVSIYGATLIAMLTCSLLYNHLPRPEWRAMLLRFDQSAIRMDQVRTLSEFVRDSAPRTYPPIVTGDS